MNCPNCNQPYEAGAAFCPNCGSPLPTTAAPVVPPAPIPSTPPTYALPPASGLAKASLWLGIVGVVLDVLMVIIAIAVGGGMPTTMTARAFQSYWESIRGAAIVITISFFLAPVSGLVGLILGIVGLSQEKIRPTQGGQTLGIVGIVLSSIPLLCCAGLLVLYLIGLASA